MNNKNNTLIKLTIGTALILGLSQTAFSVRSQEESDARAKKQEAAGNEKCAGRILAGLNDCPTSLHACAGMGDEDADPEEFIFLPKGTCEKIAGTHIIKDKKKKKVAKKSKSRKKSS